MRDLVILVADQEMEQTVRGLLNRPHAMGIGPVSFDINRHPQRDPGCYTSGPELLKLLHRRYSRGLLMLDKEWEGRRQRSAEEMEAYLRAEFSRRALQGWADVVVIDPELEVWMWSESPHVSRALNWRHQDGNLRERLASVGLWEKNSAKPSDPKSALAWALDKARTPRSSAIFREISSRVSLHNCQDPSFSRFCTILRGWFPP